MVIVQVAAAYVAASLSWPLIILAAYVFGGTINHSMSLAIHEISHNLALVIRDLWVIAFSVFS